MPLPLLGWGPLSDTTYRGLWVDSVTWASSPEPSPVDTHKDSHQALLLPWREERHASLCGDCSDG